MILKKEVEGLLKSVSESSCVAHAALLGHPDQSSRDIDLFIVLDDGQERYKSNSKNLLSLLEQISLHITNRGAFSAMAHAPYVNSDSNQPVHLLIYPSISYLSSWEPYGRALSYFGRDNIPLKIGFSYPLPPRMKHPFSPAHHLHSLYEAAILLYLGNQKEEILYDVAKRIESACKNAILDLSYALNLFVDSPTSWSVLKKLTRFLSQYSIDIDWLFEFKEHRGKLLENNVLKRHLLLSFNLYDSLMAGPYQKIGVKCGNL